MHFKRQESNYAKATAAGRGGFIEVLSISQYPDRQSWSEGTADSVRQFLWILDDVRSRRDVSDIFILPADQLYRTDFSRAAAMHRLNGADLTILTLPVTEAQSELMGVCKVEGMDSDSPLGNGQDKVWWVTKFLEKPKGEAKKGMDLTQKELRQFKKTSVKAAAAVSGDPRIIEKTLEVENQKYLQPDVDERPFIGSTGIYIFRRSVLVEILEKRRNLNDFGRDVIPWAIEAGLSVQALQIEGSWRDIGGSIKDYYQASMDIANSEVPDIVENYKTKGQLAISSSAPFCDPIAFQKAVYQAPHYLPPFRIIGKAHVSRSNISPGVSLGDGCRIVSSILGLRSRIGDNVEVTDSIIMGSDYYEKDKTSDPSPISPTFPRIGIGAGSVIKGAIVDKNARIGHDVQFVNSSKLYNSQDFAPIGVFIRDGIIVVIKSAVVPDGTIV